MIDPNNLYVDYDEYGPIEKCLQCGYEHSVDTVKTGTTTEVK